MYTHNRSDDTDVFVLLFFSQHSQPCLAMRNWTLQSGSFSMSFLRAPRRVATYLRQRAGNFLQSSRAEVLNSRGSSGNGWFNKCTSVLNIFDRPVRGPKRGQNEVNTRPGLCPQNRESMFWVWPCLCILPTKVIMYQDSYLDLLFCSR